jgi:hypothetical protein
VKPAIFAKSSSVSSLATSKMSFGVHDGRALELVAREELDRLLLRVLRGEHGRRRVHELAHRHVVGRDHEGLQAHDAAQPLLGVGDDERVEMRLLDAAQARAVLDAVQRLLRGPLLFQRHEAPAHQRADGLGGVLQVLLQVLGAALLHDGGELAHQRRRQLAHHAAGLRGVEVGEQLLRVLALQPVEQLRLLGGIELLEELHRLLPRADAEQRDALVLREVLPAVREVDRRQLLQARARRHEIARAEELLQVRQIDLQRLHPPPFYHSPAATRTERGQRGGEKSCQVPAEERCEITP